MRFWGFRDRVAADGEVVADPGVLRAEMRDAYDKGRRDERKRHRSSPLLNLGLLAVAAVGAMMLFYAAREGSFSGAGSVVDTKLSHAAAVAPSAINNAATQTGAALQDTGERLKNKAAALSSQTTDSSAPATN